MTRLTKSLLAGCLTGLSLAASTATPALAEWVPRATHGTDRSERGAQFDSPYMCLWTRSTSGMTTARPRPAAPPARR